MSLLLPQISDAIRAPKWRVLLRASGAVRALPTLATVLVLCAVAFAAVTTPSEAPRRSPSAAPRRVLAASPLISASPQRDPAPNLLVLLVDTPSAADVWLQTGRYVVVLDVSAGEARAAEALNELHLMEITFDLVDLRLAK